MLVYTVLIPNSFPQVTNPINKSTTFRIIVIADNGSGTKLDSTIPRPEILLTDAWLGTRKKYPAAAIMATATVRIPVSFIISIKLSFLLMVSLLHNLFILCASGRTPVPFRDSTIIRYQPQTIVKTLFTCPHFSACIPPI